MGATVAEVVAGVTLEDAAVGTMDGDVKVVVAVTVGTAELDCTVMGGAVEVVFRFVFAARL